MLSRARTLELLWCVQCFPYIGSTWVACPARWGDKIAQEDKIRILLFIKSPCKFTAHTDPALRPHPTLNTCAHHAAYISS